MAKWLQFSDDPAHRWELPADADVDDLSLNVAQAFLLPESRRATFPVGLANGGRLVINMARVSHVAVWDDAATSSVDPELEKLLSPGLDD